VPFQTHCGLTPPPGELRGIKALHALAAAAAALFVVTPAGDSQDVGVCATCVKASQIRAWRQFLLSGGEYGGWRIESIVDGQTLRPARASAPYVSAEPVVPSITFEHGLLRIKPGCGMFTAAYRLSGERFSFSSASWAGCYCPKESDNESARIVAALTQASYAAAYKGHITLRGDDRVVKMVLARKSSTR
jgi:hypothetical protein